MFQIVINCWHGVSFAQLPPSGCKCMAAADSGADWQLHAKFMAALDANPKSIVMVAFDKSMYQRFDMLQAHGLVRYAQLELRIANWCLVAVTV